MPLPSCCSRDNSLVRLEIRVGFKADKQRAGTGTGVIANCDAWFCGQPELMAALHRLRDGALACWCAQEAVRARDAAGACQLGFWVSAA